MAIKNVEIFIFSAVTANPVDNNDMSNYHQREHDLYRKLFTKVSDGYDRGVRPPAENPGRI